MPAPPSRAHWLPAVTSRAAIKHAARGAGGAGGARGRGAREPERRPRGLSAMFYSGLLTEGGGRKEPELREAASLRQQRRMKQAVQFIHKDSADLLPLDGLRKLGSSKDTVSPAPAPRPPRPPARPAAPGPPIAAFTESPPAPRRCPLTPCCSGCLSIHPCPRGSQGPGAPPAPRLRLLPAGLP